MLTRIRLPVNIPSHNVSHVTGVKHNIADHYFLLKQLYETTDSQFFSPKIKLLNYQIYSLQKQRVFFFPFLS